MRNPNNNPATCHPDRPAYIKGLCRPCYRKTIMTREKLNEFNEKRRNDRKEYRKEHPIEPKPKKIPWYLRNKDKVAEKARIANLARYGITVLDYDMMLQEQDGVCAICGRPPTNRSLNVDHEHQKQEKKRSPESRKERIRGLLCHRCNRALGLFGNDMNMLLFASKNLATYVERYYAKRLVDKYGEDEAKRLLENAADYLFSFEKRKPK